MKAIGLYEFGGPDVLEVLERPIPEPGPPDVRIRVRAAAVSPTDTLLRAGAHEQRLTDLAPPYIPGMDAAGDIDAVGADVANWQVGDKVMAVVIPHRPQGGAYSEYVVVPADSVARMPAEIGYVEASTLPMNALTARATLDSFALPRKATVAVTGAAGAYGGCVVQLAKADGLVVVADASEADRALVRDLGADVVVERGDRVAEAIRAEYPDGVDALADGSLQEAGTLPAIKDGGQLAVVRGWPGPTERGIVIHSIWVHRHARQAASLDALRVQVEKGQLTPRVAHVLPAEAAAQAHRELAAGGVRGRIVLTF